MMTDHSWDVTLDVDSRIGFKQHPRSLKVYAPTPLAVAITAHLSALSLEHGCGQKITLGRKWMKRARDNADFIRQQAELDGLDEYED